MPRRAVIYARVSSEDQERHGYSIPGQLRLARDYCERHGLTVDESDTVTETGSAKDAGRPSFLRVLRRLRERDAPRVLVLWDLDRATRNLHDFASLKDLWRSGVEIHLASAGLVVTQEADPGIWMAIGHKAIAAEYEVERLSQRVRMGLDEKRQRGGWCHRAPLGWRNVGSGSRRGIEPDPERAPLVAQLYDAYADGAATLHDLTDLAARIGLRSREGRRLDRQAISRLLQHPVHAGFIPTGQRNSRHGFRGGLIEGDHEPIVERATWWRVQELLETRRRRRGSADPSMLFGGGLLRCGHCGAAVTGTIHRRRAQHYRYYACSRAIRGDGCEGYEGYVREADVVRQVREALEKLSFSPDVAPDVRGQVVETWRAETRTTRQKIETLRKRHDQIGRMIDAMYEERLLGQVTADEYERRSRSWESERARLTEEMARVESSTTMTRAALESAVTALGDLSGLWTRLEFSDRREFLRVACLKRSLTGRAVSLEWSEPFETVGLAAADDRARKAGGESKSRRLIRLARDSGRSWKTACVLILAESGEALARWSDAA